MKAQSGYQFNCRTRFNIGDIVYLREKNAYDYIVKKGPIKIIGIELRVNMKGELKVWYNCETANGYKFQFRSKGKHYLQESELLTEEEIEQRGYDIESEGSTRFYHPDGTPKTEEEVTAEAKAYWESKGRHIVETEYGWYVQ